jgi:hypothetical protein
VLLRAAHLVADNDLQPAATGKGIDFRQFRDSRITRIERDDVALAKARYNAAANAPDVGLPYAPNFMLGCRAGHKRRLAAIIAFTQRWSLAHSRAADESGSMPGDGNRKRPSAPDPA